jgi:hypothetical protein
MRQVIETKYLAPTNNRGSRIKASCQGGSITVPFDYSLNTNDRHLAAAVALAEKLEWKGELKGGWLPNGNGVFVFV